MSDDFEVDFFSDSRYEEITIEISYGGQILCQLNKDKGPDNIEIEFFHASRILAEQNAMKFSLSSFIKILDEVETELKRS